MPRKARERVTVRYVRLPIGAAAVVVAQRSNDGKAEMLRK